MRHREASALALVAVLQGRRQQPRLHHLGPGMPIHVPSSTIQPSSTLRHPLSLGATPVVDEQDDLDLENDGLGDFIVGESSLTTSTRSNQTSIEAVQKQGISVNEKEAAGAILLLNLVAVLWGTQHAVIKMVVDDSSAAPFTLLRFALAALIAAPYTPGIFPSSSDETPNKEQTATAWRWGAEMGAWMFLGFSFQALGLETTTAQRSGFLLYLNVKFVPFFSRVLLGRQISIPTWASALAAFCGTALLATDGESIGFNTGDIWSIAAAAASAMYIIRLEKAATSVNDAAQLNAACLWVVALLASVWTFAGTFGTESGMTDTLEQLFSTAKSYPFQIIYLGAVTTTLANYIQSRGQQYISPERASIIYSLDPVYGAFFSWFLLGENIGGVQSFLGAGLITVAAATNAFLDFGKQDDDSPHSKR